MKTINAYSAALTVHTVREAVKDLPKETIARLHPAQEAAWEMMAICVFHANSGDLIADRITKPTIGGHVMAVDETFRPDSIRFELNGTPLVEIVNLAIPMGYERGIEAQA